MQLGADVDSDPASVVSSVPGTPASFGGALGRHREGIISRSLTQFLCSMSNESVKRGQKLAVAMPIVVFCRVYILLFVYGFQNGLL